MVDKSTLFTLLAFLALGVFGYTRVRALVRLSFQTRSWASTKGRVLEAKIVGWERRHAQILYEFNAPGKIIGSRLCAPGCEEGDPNVYIRWYRVGKEILVHYNPADPRDCLLELPNQRTIGAWKLLTLIGLTFPCGYLLWWGYLNGWVVD